MVNYKNYIIESLTILKQNAIKEGGTFQARAYSKVINNINIIKEPIIQYKQLENIEGVGSKMKIKFKEIFETGKLKEAEELKNEIIDNKKDEDIYSKLLLIYGIGPSKAKNLIEEHKIKSISDLKIKSKKDEKLLTSSQKIGLLCYEDLLERIPRKEMVKHQKLLNISNNKGEIVGSFRRKSESSGDIDVMLNMSIVEFKEYIEYLKSINYLKFILAKGDKKMLGICQLKNGKYRRLDLIRNSPEEYPFMKLYFTGSGEFNVAFRSHCLKKGLSLNEHGFTPKVEGLKTEKDIFKYVGIKYVEPENRIDSRSLIS
jgi:DNA polymerase (family 10)